MINYHIYYNFHKILLMVINEPIMIMIAIKEKSLKSRFLRESKLSEYYII